MYKKLYKYFVLNKKISFPGIGSFVVEDVSSLVDETAHIIKPGLQTIRFSNNSENNFNHSLFSFLAKECNQTEIESENKFNIFIVKLKICLRLNDVALPALGTLKKYNGDEGVAFVPQQKNIKHLFPLIELTEQLNTAAKKETSIPAQPVAGSQTPAAPLPQQEVIAVEEERTAATVKKRKSSWWIYAIVLMLVAAAGLLYYYLYYINRPG